MFLRVSIFFCLLLVGSMVAKAQSARANESRDVRDLVNDINILYVAIQPGFEDTRVLGHFREMHSARIRTLFVTNGEGGEADGRSLLPMQLAARLRLESASVAEALEGDARFLCMPDIVAASDTALHTAWPPDTLRDKLEGSIMEFKPDLILIGGDRMYGQSPRLRAVTSAVVSAVRRAAARATAPWKTLRVAIEVPSGGMPLKSNPPFESIQPDGYETIAHQRRGWLANASTRYAILYPSSGRATSIETGLPVSSPSIIRSLDKRIRNFGNSFFSRTQRDTSRALREILSIMDSIDLRLFLASQNAHLERRRLLRWKGGLDAHRNELLGVRVRYEVSDTILTERQVTFLTIKEVQGLSDSGTTEVFFPAVDQGWVLNENTERKLPLSVNQEYRLLSPAQLEYNYPQSDYGLLQPQVRKPSYFFIIHRAKERARSFVFRADMRLWHAPRFTVEALTPIVRAVSGERIIVRLTNHSRDGVRDSIYIKDSLVTARGRMFKLADKGASHVDTLWPVWKPTSPEGSHIADILIGGIQVGRFVWRKFDAKIESAKPVGIISTIQDSPVQEALRRLGVHSRQADALLLADATSPFDVVIIDRRAISMAQPQRRSLLQFVENGGHLVVLAQDGDVLKEFPLLSDVTLQTSFAFDGEIGVIADVQHPLLRTPNVLSVSDFEGWVFRKAFNRVKVNDSFAAPVKAATGEPLLVTKKVGRGRVTYVDLDLSHQWMNIHAGALRLLANLVARSEKVGG